MLLRRTTAALMTGGLVVLSGCSGSDGEAEAEATPEFATYVALGDSYTAAPGVPQTDLTTGCARSDGNYPALLAAELDTDLTDVSCSGASTLNLIGVQTAFGGAQIPPQFDALGADTSLVTMGMGGNDESLYSTLVGTCTDLAAADPQGTPCQDQFGDRLETTLSTIQDRVTAALQGIRDRAPDATVVLVGYPQPVPESGTCPDLPLAAGDYAFAREVTAQLNDALRDAASAEDVIFVDLAEASEGHDICAGDDAWVQGTQTDLSKAIAFHPFANEQQAVADLIVEALS